MKSSDQMTSIIDLMWEPEETVELLSPTMTQQCMDMSCYPGITLPWLCMSCFPMSSNRNWIC